MGLWRLLSAIWAKITGRTSKIAKKMEVDPDVIRVRYENMVKQRKDDINNYIEAMSIGKTQVKTNGEKLTELQTKHKAHAAADKGVLGLMKKLQEGRLAGLSIEEMKQDRAFADLYAQHQNFFTTVKALESSIQQTEALIASLNERYEANRKGLLKIQSEIEDLKREGGELVMRVVSAKVRGEMAALEASISNSGVGEKRQEMREMVAQMEAKAEITEELAGSSADEQVAKYASLANDAEADAALMSALGISTEVEAAPPAPAKKVKTDGSDAGRVFPAGGDGSGSEQGA